MVRRTGIPAVTSRVVGWKARSTAVTLNSWTRGPAQALRISPRAGRTRAVKLLIPLFSFGVALRFSPRTGIPSSAIWPAPMAGNIARRECRMQAAGSRRLGAGRAPVHPVIARPPPGGRGNLIPAGTRLLPYGLYPLQGTRRGADRQGRDAHLHRACGAPPTCPPGRTPR